MARRPVVVGFAIVAAFGLAAVIAAWLLTREPRMAAAPASPAEAPAPPPRSEPPSPPPAPPPVVQAPPADLPPVNAPEAQVEVTPLFLPNRTLTLGKTAALEFQARRKGSADPAANEPISVSVVKVGERAELSLPVKEVALGVYRAEFTPRDTGKFVVAVASRGVPAATVPVVVPERAPERR